MKKAIAYALIMIKDRSFRIAPPLLEGYTYRKADSTRYQDFGDKPPIGHSIPYQLVQKCKH